MTLVATITTKQSEKEERIEQSGALATARPGGPSLTGQPSNPRNKGGGVLSFLYPESISCDAAKDAVKEPEVAYAPFAQH